MILASALMLLQAATTYPLDARGQVRQLDDPLALAARVVAICAASVASPVVLAQREITLSRQLSVQQHDAAWDSLANTLACVRSIQSSRGLFGQEGYLMPLGTRLDHAAIALLRIVLGDRPSDLMAAQLLAVLGPSVAWTDSIVPGQGASSGEPAEPLANLLFAAVRAGVVDSAVFRGCTSLMLDAADYDTARECSGRALQHGADSTWHLLRLADIAMHTPDSMLGMRYVDAAVVAANDRQARLDLAWHLDLRARELRQLGLWKSMPLVLPALQPEALNRWLSLRDSAARIAWVGSRLDTMMRRTGRSEAALWRDHFASITYARANFHDCNRATDVLLVFIAKNPHEQSLPDGPVITKNPRWPPPCFQSWPPDIHQVEVAASRYRLWEPGSGRPVSVTTWAVPLNSLVPFDDSGSVVGVQVDFRERNAGTSTWFDTTLIRSAHTASPGHAGSMQGVIVTARADEAADWSLGVVQAENRRGFVNHDDGPLGGGAVALSDLVIGDPTQHVAWTIGGDSIVLAPLGAVSQRALLELFVQLRAPVAQPRVRFTLSVYRISDGQPASRPVLQVASTGPVKAGISGIHRELDVARLGRGQYQLRLQVATDSGTVERTARVTVR
ncbi:MAG TPA: hypothetical protein VGM77_09420 [Gemmatimonadales bacterium]|jgi:hypothetical protein